MGRLPKTTAQHKRDGTYDSSRHDDRIDDRYEGTPEQIRGLGKDGVYMFKLAVNNSPHGVLVKTDEASLFAMCRWWALYRKYDRRSMSAKGTTHDIHMAVCAWKQCHTLMIQFGMTPVARTKLRMGNVDPKENPQDPIAQMAKNREAIAGKITPKKKSG